MTNQATEPSVLESIFGKGNEFYTCARHMHMRGMADVLEETKPIVRKAKEEGKTFDDVQKMAEELGGQPLDLEKDKFLAAVKQMFEEAA